MDIEERIKTFLILHDELLRLEPSNISEIDRIKGELEKTLSRPNYSNENPLQIDHVRIPPVKRAFLDFTYSPYVDYVEYMGYRPFQIIAIYPPIDIDWCSGLWGESNDGYLYCSSGNVFRQDSEYGFISICRAEENINFKIGSSIIPKEGNLFQVARMDERTREFINKLIGQAEPQLPEYERYSLIHYVINGYFIPKIDGREDLRRDVRVLTYPQIALVGIEFDEIGNGALTALFNHLRLMETPQ